MHQNSFKYTCICMYGTYVLKKCILSFKGPRDGAHTFDTIRWHINFVIILFHASSSTCGMDVAMLLIVVMIHIIRVLCTIHMAHIIKWEQIVHVGHVGHVAVFVHMVHVGHVLRMRMRNVGHLLQMLCTYVTHVPYSQVVHT